MLNEIWNNGTSIMWMRWNGIRVDFEFKGKKDMIISIIFLAAADQVVKIIVNRNYMDLRFNITSWLGLHPHLNTDQMSILNNEFNLNVDHRILIIIEIVLFIALAFFYLYIERVPKYSIG